MVAQYWSIIACPLIGKPYVAQRFKRIGTADRVCKAKYGPRSYVLRSDLVSDEIRNQAKPHLGEKANG
jgi:hypothetical protein